MRTDTESPRRGRPPAYDRGRALAAIRDVFWRRGFSATSLDELAAAAGMNRPSLYGAFGDKRAMYLAAMGLFSDDLRRRVGEALAEPRVDEALRRFYAVILDVHLEEGRGCYVSGTAPVEALRDPVMREALAGSFRALDAGLEARMRRAQADGDLALDADPAALAAVAASVVHSLALRVRAGASREELETITDQVRKLVR